jgi:hypothetical protein
MKYSWDISDVVLESRGRLPQKLINAKCLLNIEVRSFNIFEENLNQVLQEFIIDTKIKFFLYKMCFCSKVKLNWMIRRAHGTQRRTTWLS